jgi:hypothetical protein
MESSSAMACSKPRLSTAGDAGAALDMDQARFQSEQGCFMTLTWQGLQAKSKRFAVQLTDFAEKEIIFSAKAVG